MQSLLMQGCRQGGAGGASAPTIFDRSVNPISIRRGGADYAHHSTTSPPGFSDLATALAVMGVVGTFGNVQHLN